MQNRGADEPDREVDDTATPNDLSERITRDRECDRVYGDLQDGYADGSPLHSRRKVRLPIHLVQCTPGTAGRISRAG